MKGITYIGKKETKESGGRGVHYPIHTPNSMASSSPCLHCFCKCSKVVSFVLVNFHKFQPSKCPFYFFEEKFDHL
jgi:hypothetical protein